VSASNLDEECSGIAFSKQLHPYIDTSYLNLLFLVWSDFLVSHITKQSPIKVTQRKKTVNSETLFDSWMAWIDRKSCFHQLMNSFGYIPLMKSQVRLEPLLYKDAVSSIRKKYRKLESIV